MSNMAYCRFNNTELALQDCVDSLNERDEYGLDERGNEISEEEQLKAKNMVSLCEEYIEAHEEYITNLDRSLV